MLLGFNPLFLYSGGDSFWVNEYTERRSLGSISGLNNGGFILGGGADSTELGSGAAGLIKVGQEGEILGSRRIDLSGGFGFANALANADGSFYVHTRSNAFPGSPLIKYDQDFNFVWARQNGDLNASNVASTLATGPSGGVYASSDGPSSTVNVVSFDADGARIWERRINPPTAASPFIEGISSDSFGNVYVNFSEQADFASYFVKLSPAGVILWGRKIGNASNECFVRRTFVDSNDDLYFFAETGLNPFEASGTNPIIGKISSSGDILFQKQLVLPSRASPLGFFIDEADNLYCTLTISGSSRFYKLASDGSVIWARQLTKNGNAYGFNRGIYVNSQGLYFGPSGGDFMKVSRDSLLINSQGYEVAPVAVVTASDNFPFISRTFSSSVPSDNWTVRDVDPMADPSNPVRTFIRLEA